MSYYFTEPDTERAAISRTLALSSSTRLGAPAPHRGPKFTSVLSAKYTDDETGLVMYQLRPYSPGLGRFISRDPAEEDGGVNLYKSFDNDPSDMIDPVGLRAELNLDSMNDGAVAAVSAVQALVIYTGLPIVGTKAFYERIRESLRWTRDNYAESSFAIIYGKSMTALRKSKSNTNDRKLKEKYAAAVARYKKQSPHSQAPGKLKENSERSGIMDVQSIINAKSSVSVEYVVGANGTYHSHPANLVASADPSPADYDKLAAFKSLNEDVNADKLTEKPIAYWGFVAKPVLTDASLKTFPTAKMAELIVYRSEHGSATSSGIFIKCW